MSRPVFEGVLREWYRFDGPRTNQGESFAEDGALARLDNLNRPDKKSPLQHVGDGRQGTRGVEEAPQMISMFRLCPIRGTVARWKVQMMYRPWRPLTMPYRVSRFDSWGRSRSVAPLKHAYRFHCSCICHFRIYSALLTLQVRSLLWWRRSSARRRKTHEDFETIVYTPFCHSIRTHFIQKHG